MVERKPGSLTKRVVTVEEKLDFLTASVKGIAQRLTSIEAKLDDSNKHATDGNGTRNAIMILVAAKVLFDGLGSVNFDTVHQLLKLFAGG